MRATCIASVAAALLAITATPVSASSGMHLSGGGTATISQVAFDVSIEGSGTASGSFNCLMAGRSSSVLGAFGLSHLMKVQIHPDAATAQGAMVEFSGSGFLITDGGKTRSIHAEVSADVATQQFQLTVDGIGSMPVETMETGGFELR
jgi:hypothetical protein